MSKRLILFILFLCLGAFTFAQQVDNYHQDTTTLYQRAKGFSQDPIRSKWRQEVKKVGDAWILNLYDKKNVLQERISFADKDLLERKGGYVLYQNGGVKEEGNYEKGYKVGEWRIYHKNKQLSEKINYVWDKLSGLCLTYWDNGQIKESKNYLNGVKTRGWQFFYKDGKMALSETYDEQGKVVTGAYFDEQGKAVDRAYVMKALI